jgi:acyl-CoA hydrolase
MCEYVVQNINRVGTTSLKVKVNSWMESHPPSRWSQNSFITITTKKYLQKNKNYKKKKNMEKCLFSFFCVNICRIHGSHNFMFCLFRRKIFFI